MSRFPCLRASFVLLLGLETSCHRKQVAVPLPPPPAENQPAAATPQPSATTPDTPGTTTHPALEPTAPYQTNKPPQPPPQPAKKPARSATAPVAAPAAPASAPATPPAPAPPPPKLGDILTPDEQRQYNASIDQSLSRAQASLNSIAGRQLNKDQQAEVEQIRNFMQQAQATRNPDPAGARSLAARAEVLARDLAASFH
jgi:hypothetical protein